MRASRWRQSPSAGRQNIGAGRQDARQLDPQETQTLPDCNTPLQQEGADLIDDAGALTDQALSGAVQGLQVKLVGGLGRNELHGWALHRLEMFGLMPMKPSPYRSRVC